MHIAHLALVTAVVLCLATAAFTAPSPRYPIKAVAMLVGWPPGQAIDLIARALVDATRPHFPVYVVNRPGGAGTVAAAEVVLAKPDGYTIGITALAVMAVQPHLTDLPYKTPEDYRPVIKVGGHAVVLAVRADAPWRTIGDLVQYARANPGKVRVGTAGVGTIPHLNLESLKETSGVSLTHVPFAGGGEYVPALLGGHIEAIAALPVEVIPHVRAGRLRVLGIFSSKRSPFFPEAQLFRELGYDITTEIYHFIFAPKATSDYVIRILHAAFKRGLDSEQFKKFAHDANYVIDYMGPHDLKRQLERDYAFFGDLIRKLKLR